MKERTNLEWKEYRENGIDTNPLECWWAIGTVAEYPRLYCIYPQYPNPNGDGYTTDESNGPELYVLTETIARDKGKKSIEDFPERHHFIRAFDTLEKAKDRASVQIDAIKDILEQYFWGEESPSP